MKNYLILFLSLFLIVSCQKDLNEDIIEIEIDSRSVTFNSEAITAGEFIRDHFHNNKASDPLLLLPEEYREEFNNRLNYLTNDYSDDLEFSSVLQKLRKEFGLSKEVSNELQLFHDGLIAAITWAKGNFHGQLFTWAGVSSAVALVLPHRGICEKVRYWPEH